MVTKLSTRTALVMWVLTVALSVAAAANVALEPTAGAWRTLGVSLLPMGTWFWIWRQRRRTLDGTLDRPT
jgi:hypothetical protein